MIQRRGSDFPVICSFFLMVILTVIHIRLSEVMKNWTFFVRNCVKFKTWNGEIQNSYIAEQYKDRSQEMNILSQKKLALKALLLPTGYNGRIVGLDRLEGDMRNMNSADKVDDDACQKEKSAENNVSHDIAWGMWC